MKMLAFLNTPILFSGLVDEYNKLIKAGIETYIVQVFDNIDEKGNRIINFEENKPTISEVLVEKIPVKAIIIPSDYYADKIQNLPNIRTQNERKISCCEMKDLKNKKQISYLPYILQDLFPDIDYYWFINWDIYYNGNSYSKFFATYNEERYDFISAYCEEFSVISDGIFRISNRALKYLLERRLVTNSSEETKIFLYKELVNNPNFSSKRIFGQKISFDKEINIAAERMWLKKDNKIYYPVYWIDEFFKKY